MKTTRLLPLKSLFLATTAASLFAAFAASAAETADASESIVVTAQRRAERLQDVPITIANITADTMRQMSVQSLSDISKVTAGVRFDVRSTFVTPAIRGLSTSIVLAGGGTNIGLYLDGFYSPALQAADFELMNVDNIQVLKGPQGTLFGRNTTGGAILVTTAKPSTTTKVILQGSYGSWNAQKYQVYATTGLSDRLAVDITAMLSKGDGWAKNIFTNDDKVGRYRNTSLRVGVNYDVTDNFSMLLRYAHAQKNDPTQLMQNVFVLDGRPACFGCTLPGAVFSTKRGEVAADEPLTYVYSMDNYQLTLNWDLGFANLTSYSQYRKDRGQQVYTLDYTSLALLALTILDRNKTITQEFLLTSKPGPRLQWTFGAFYYDYKSEFAFVGIAPAGQVRPRFPFPKFSESHATSESIAVYGDATYEVVDNLFLTAGLRYTHDAVKDAYSEFAGFTNKFPPTLTTSRVTPRGVIRYQLTGDSSVYGSVAKGYKAAIYNIGAPVGNTVPIAPEGIWAYEVGYKYAGADLSFNASAYYYDYTNEQLAQYRVVNGTPQSSITNAASSELYGIDADIHYQLTDNFEVNVGAEWSHARYKSFPFAPDFAFNAIGQLVNITRDASGGAMTRAPDFTANVGAAYTTEVSRGTLVLSGNLYYTSRFYFDLAQHIPEKAYVLLDLRAEWTDPTERYSLAIAGKNLTDTKYHVQGGQNALGIGAVYGPPPSVEGSLRIKF